MITFKSHPEKSDLWEIFIDGHQWREVHQTIFGKKPVFPPFATPENLPVLFNEYEYQRAKGYVIWRLSSQSYHSEQLAKLLRDRLVQKETIERVITEFLHKGYLNDEAWLQNYLTSQLKRYPLRNILNKLYAKGLSKPTLASIGNRWKKPHSEMEAIKKILKKRSQTSDLSDYKARQKIIGSLLRKGFVFDEIQQALKNLECG